MNTNTFDDGLALAHDNSEWFEMSDRGTWAVLTSAALLVASVLGLISFIVR